MDTLKEGLMHMHDRLAELENAARKLQNQNFADIVKSARGKLSQAAEHPDVDQVAEHLRTDLAAEQRPLPFEPDAPAA